MVEVVRVIENAGPRNRVQVIEQLLQIARLAPGQYYEAPLGKEAKFAS